MKMKTKRVRFMGQRYSVPIIDKLHQRILRAIKKEGNRLDMGEWHGLANVCGTTHCRGGWAVHLCGKQGYDLEERTIPEQAARLIFHVNTTEYPLSKTEYEYAELGARNQSPFFWENVMAMADIIACAEREALVQGVLKDDE